MAYAGAEFTSFVLKALKGEKGIVVPTFVSLESDPAGGAALKKELGADLEFFSANVELGVCLARRLITTRSSDYFFSSPYLVSGRREDSPAR